MRVFVSEYVCGGAWPEPELPTSLAREGRAMLESIVADFARIPGVSVATTWNERLGVFCVADVAAHAVCDPVDERRRFEHLAAECDATLVIAPEFDGILEERARAVLGAGGRLLGPEPEAIALCSDKLALARHLEARGFPTIATELWDPKGECGSLPCVLKPRDGAGSLDVHLVRTRDDDSRIGSDLANTGRAFIRQPYVPGRALSASVILTPDRVHLFPAGEQLLSDDGRFTYLGGAIPAQTTPDRTRIDAMLEDVCRSIPGLNGYVGFDLVQPDGDPERLLICEINPRLTTSYLGYRRLAYENLAERMLFPERDSTPIAWKDGRVRFRADGTVTHQA